MEKIKMEKNLNGKNQDGKKSRWKVNQDSSG